MKSVPQRRNKLAGKGKAKASENKKQYDSQYHSTPAVSYTHLTLPTKA